MFDAPKSPDFEAGAVDVPIYHYLVIAVESLFETDDYIVGRALSTIFILPAIVFFFLFAEALFGPIEGLVATFFFALSPLCLLIGKLYQAEALILFLLIIACFLLVLFRKKQGYPFLLASLVCIMVAVSMKPFSLLYLAPFAVIALEQRKSISKKEWLILIAVGGLCFALIAAWFIKRISLAPYGVGNRLTGWPEHLKFENFIDDLYFLLHFHMFGKLPLLYLALSGLTLPFWKPKVRYFFLAWFFALAFYYYYTATHISTHNYYHIQDMPFLCLLPAGLIYFVREKIHDRPKIVKVTGLTIITAITVVAGYFFFSNTLHAYKKVLLIGPESQRSIKEAADHLTAISNQANDFVLIKMADERDHYFRYRAPHACWYKGYFNFEVLDSFLKKGIEYIVYFTNPGYEKKPKPEVEADLHLLKNYRLVDMGTDHMTFDMSQRSEADYNGLILETLSGRDFKAYSKDYSIQFKHIHQKFKPLDALKTEIWITPQKEKSNPIIPLAYAVFESTQESNRMRMNPLPYFLASETWLPGKAYKIEFTNEIPDNAPAGRYKIMVGLFKPKRSNLIIGKGYLRSIQEGAADENQFIQVGTFNVSR